ncbi:MAG: hypothetical protein AAF353_11160 [Pseudomonadota bacterium]
MRVNTGKVYYEKIDGMDWGPGTRKGVLNGNLFSHPELSFSLRLPDGWQVKNTEAMLLAKNADNGALAQIGVVGKEPNETLPDLLKRLTRNNKLEVSQENWGVTAITRVKPGDKPYQPARLSAIALDNNQVLTLMGTSTKQHFKKSSAQFTAINSSFKRLSKAEAAAVTSPKISIVKPDENMTFSDLAEQSPIDYEAENILRLINGSFPKGGVTDNKQIKTITLDD